MKNPSKNEVEYRHRFLTDFWLIFGPFLEPKSVQNRFRSGLGRALHEDSDLKLKKERSGLNGSPQTGRFWGLCGEGNREGTVSFTRLATCPRTGVGGFLQEADRATVNGSRQPHVGVRRKQV